MLKTAPAVFAVGNDYQIMVPVMKPSLMWVKVGDKCYYDESNGVMRSQTPIHRMTVPVTALDRAKKYTVCERVIIDRQPYCPEIEDVVETEFSFSPVGSSSARAYHIADAHNMVTEPIKAAKAFGKIDFLILNGDIPNHSGDVENFDAIYEIAAELTNGSIPVVFARGNHDMRGIYAEQFTEYTPCDKGNSYFTFRIGGFWGMVLDCGEDKDDGHEEYGGTVCCHVFRERQTQFIRHVIENAENEYLADGVTHRLVVAHNPFTRVFKPPFNIERNIYSHWATMLKNHVKPDVMICGHNHNLIVSKPGSDYDDLGQPCTVVVGSKPGKKSFAGAGYTFEEDKITVNFTDSDGSVKKPHIINIQKTD